MKIVALTIVAVLFLIFWDLLFMALGYLLCRTEKFHKIGIRFLAMSMFVSGRKVAEKCQMTCYETRCGNWTCENYHHSKRR